MMPRNIDDRLARLKTRRSGADRVSRVATAAREEVFAKALLLEDYERLPVKKTTRYALGAMQAVDAEGTRKSLESADRVGKQLDAKLSMGVELALQGSVPLDVHIRGVSDVDLLVLDKRMLTYSAFGARASLYFSTTLRSLSTLMELRSEAELVLKAAYPGVDVDCSGGKCISLSGGSLARPVDVVPAHWNDTAEYQASLAQHDRGVTILNKRVPTTIDNLPFLHIKRINDADDLAAGGLKKAIRLTKNVKNDADDQDRACKLPSFDIAALLFHADRSALRAGVLYELAILDEAQRFLDWCCKNRSEAEKLLTPDGTRTILNTNDKFDALVAISIEMDDLAAKVAAEQLAVVTNIDEQRRRKILRETYIPRAA